jgi:hypothetical protein
MIPLDGAFAILTLSASSGVSLLARSVGELFTVSTSTDQSSINSRLVISKLAKLLLWHGSCPLTTSSKAKEVRHEQP